MMQQLSLHVPGIAMRQPIEPARQRPISDKRAESYKERLFVVIHPAFRLGYLDAVAGRGIDHDDIIARIERETPASALQALPWSDFLRNECQLAQYRYEEGRLCWVQLRLVVKGWSHPLFPPKAIDDLCRNPWPAVERGWP